MTKLKLTDLPKINFFGLNNALDKLECVIRKETICEQNPINFKYNTRKREYAIVKGDYIYKHKDSNTKFQVGIHISIKEGGMDYRDEWCLRVLMGSDNEYNTGEYRGILYITKEQGESENYPVIIKAINQIIKETWRQNNRKHD